MKKPAPLGVVILAGGRGQRMGGQDKGWIRYQGKYLIMQVLDQFKCQFDGPLVISANRHLEDYRQFGFPVIADQDVITLDYAGPLVGVLGAMETGLAKYWLCWPVDAPYLPSNYVTEMTALIEQHQPLLVQTWCADQLEPLQMAMADACSTWLRPFLLNGNRAVKAWSDAVSTAYPEQTVQRHLSQISGININSPADLNDA